MCITVFDVCVLCLVLKFSWNMCTVGQSLGERRRETGLGLPSSWREKIKGVRPRYVVLRMRLNCLRCLQGLWRWPESDNVGQLL